MMSKKTVGEKLHSIANPLHKIISKLSDMFYCSPGDSRQYELQQKVCCEF